MTNTTNITTRPSVGQGPNEAVIYTAQDFINNAASHAAGVITLKGDYVYTCKGTIDLGTDTIVFGERTKLKGDAFNLTIVTTNSAVTAFTMQAIDVAELGEIRIEQTGSGALLRVDLNAGDQSFLTMVGCTLAGGDVLMVQGGSLVKRRTLVSEGARLVQTTDGGKTGIKNIRISGNGGIFDGAATDGLVVFETGTITNSLDFEAELWVAFFASTLIKIEGTATITNMTVSGPTFSIVNAAAVGIDVANPNNISSGTLEDIALTNLGTFLQCSPISSSTLTTVTAPFGVCQDRDDTFTDGNLIVSDFINDVVQRYQGLTNTTNGAALAITAPEHVAWHRGDLYVLTGTDITQYDGYSTSVLVTLDLTPIVASIDPRGFTFVNDNLVVGDDNGGLGYLLDGFSSNVLSSFTLPTTVLQGISFDGMNLLIADSAGNDVYVMQGVSSDVQYSFVSAALAQLDICSLIQRSPFVQGFAVVDSDVGQANIKLYDHPVTFDHSSPTWKIEEVPGIIESADRGGVQFSTPDTGSPPTLTILDDVYSDISATGISYNAFSENEKMMLNDESNGEIVWLASLAQGRIINMQVNVSKTGGGGSNDFFQFAISINGVVESDSATTIVLRAASEFSTVSSIPVSRDLVVGDILKAQIKGVGTTASLELIQSKTTIT